MKIRTNNPKGLREYLYTSIDDSEWQFARAIFKRLFSTFTGNLKFRVANLWSEEKKIRKHKNVNNRIEQIKKSEKWEAVINFSGLLIGAHKRDQK